MSNVAYLPIEADRYGACVRQIYIRGLDLTGIAMRAQVRLAGDTPGAPEVDLRNTTNGNAEGLRLVGVESVDGFPISHVELVISETTMEGLPYVGEQGSATELRWDWQATLGGRKQRIAKGEFIITGDGVTGADYAPVDRPQAWARSFSASSGMRTGATLNFGDEVIAITIDGANLLAPLAAQAQAALDRINEFTTGPAGPANSTYTTLAKFKQADVTNVSANYDGDLWFFTQGDHSNRPAGDYDTLVVEADGFPLSAGAWVRSIGPFVTLKQFGAIDDAEGYEFGRNATDSTDAIAKAFASGKSIRDGGTYLTRGAQWAGANGEDNGTYVGCKLTSAKVTLEGFTLVKKRDADGIPLYIEGENNTIRGVKLQGYNSSLEGRLDTLTGSVTASIAFDGTSNVVTISSGSVTVGTFISWRADPYYEFFVTEKLSANTYRLSGTPAAIPAQAMLWRRTILTADDVIGTIRTVPSGGYGSMLSGDDVNPRTMIIAQLSGTPGKDGVYAVNVAADLPTRIMRFTDAPILNLRGDMVRMLRTPKRTTFEDFEVDGSPGNGIQNFATPGLTVAGKTRIVGCLENGIINANAGADDFEVGDGVVVRGTGRQNGIFATANAASQPTADHIRRVTIGAVVVGDCGDTALEIGQGCESVTITAPKLGPAQNAPLLFRDAAVIRADRALLIAPPLAEQDPGYAPVAILPYYQGQAWNCDLVLSNLRFAQPAKQGFAKINQSNVTICDCRNIDTGAAEPDGSDQRGAFLTIEAGTWGVTSLRNKAQGFAVDYLFNPAGTVGGTIDRFTAEGNEFTNLGRHIAAYGTAFTRSRSVDILRRIKTGIYNVVAASSIPVDGIPGLICADSYIPDGIGTPSFFSPDDAPLRGFAVRLNTIELALPETKFGVTYIAPLAALGNKVGTLTITDASGDITVSVSATAKTVTKLSGSSEFFGTDGANGNVGYAVYSISGALAVQRRGDSTGVPTTRSFQWSTT